MSTFKMTFSLASLILILGLVFATAPAMAHPATAENTDTVSDTAQIHAVSTATDHMHPVVEVIITDANPNTRAIEVVDTEADTPVFTADVTPTIEFDVTLRIPAGTAGTTVTATVVAYGSDFLAVGTLTGTTFAQGTLGDDGTFTTGSADTDRDYQANLVLTLANVPFATDGADADANAALTETAHDEAIAAAITAGIMFDITVAENIIQATGLLGGPMAGQGNLGSKTTVTVVADTTTLMPPELADMAHLIVVRDINNPPDFGTAEPTLLQWAEMPDLYKLFNENTEGGGSLQLTLMTTDADGAAVALKKTDDSAFGARAVVFSEVMWARDEGMAGLDSQIDNQWIELYNRSGEAIPHSAFTFMTKEGRPALGAGIDLISNVVATGGGNWISTKGQNGNSGTTDASGQVTGQQEFISMFRSNRGADGANGGHWGKSTQLYKPNHRGTPGDKEIVAPRTFTRTPLARSPFIFNEIGNHANNDYDWIEVRNVTDATQNLRNRRISIIKGLNDDTTLVTFPNDKDYNVSAGGVFLIVKTDPSGNDNHPLAAGFNVDKAANAQVRGVPADHPVRYKVLSGLALPNGNFVLALRGNDDKHLGKPDGVIDVAGYHSNLAVNTPALFTNMWPLEAFPPANRANNNFVNGKVYRRQYAGIDGTTSSANNNNNDKTAFRSDDNGWTGIGYKRNAATATAEQRAQNGGTPGYPHGAKHTEGADVRAAVMISEIMYAHTDRTTLQWIELRNTSSTIGADVSNWELAIVNHNEMMVVDDMGVETMDDFDDALNPIVNLSGFIPPGQSYLIVSSKVTGARRNSTNLPDDRIKDAGKRGNELLLNPYGFQLTLRTNRDKAFVAADHLVDEVGNLMPAPANSRRSDAQSFNDDVAWNLPTDVFNEDGDRISVVRVLGVASGTDRYALAVYTDTREYDQIRNLTYYGDDDDISSPGHYHGGVLPVSLSKFRPERMRDTGQVVIRWVTESELNNAGFNILRSETRNGEFTKVNTQLIAGQGTTSERTVYEFIDTTAKPNVVYYYQIQDVSLDGDVTTLRTTHLRGNVTAAGKLTTTWSEIKTLRE